jgi:predicted transposase/invertase (TIGR01784 family)
MEPMARKALKPVFADPKLDLPFKKAFGTLEHKNLLIELLNDLLRLPPEARIVDLEYLSGEQLPAFDGLKLSILDVKCTDTQGARYVVEMQVFPVEGFEKRVVLNASNAYVEQLESGNDYAQLSDVVAVTICNFSLFGKKVPMLSRWRMREDESHEAGLSQIQYVFLELTKYDRKRKPRTVVEKWAYFFRDAEKLREVPPELAEAPFAEALEVVRRVNFSETEWTEYERAKMAEQDYQGGLNLARQQGMQEGKDLGLKEGKDLGLKEGMRQALVDLCEVLGIEISAARHAVLASMDLGQLEEIRDHVKARRTWPADS